MFIEASEKTEVQEDQWQCAVNQLEIAGLPAELFTVDNIRGRKRNKIFSSVAIIMASLSSKLYIALSITLRSGSIC